VHARAHGAANVSCTSSAGNSSCTSAGPGAAGTTVDGPGGVAGHGASATLASAGQGAAVGSCAAGAGVARPDGAAVSLALDRLVRGSLVGAPALDGRVSVLSLGGQPGELFLDGQVRVHSLDAVAGGVRKSGEEALADRDDLGALQLSLESLALEPADFAELQELAGAPWADLALALDGDAALQDGEQAELARRVEREVAEKIAEAQREL
jgi:hypothetical protein